MVTVSVPSKPNVQLVPNSLGYDFALLGLRARESRVHVIRRAAKATAARIHKADIGDGEQEALLSDIATSTYRLLDPRRRHRFSERVQLSLFSEEDLERQSGSRHGLLPAPSSTSA